MHSQLSWSYRFDAISDSAIAVGSSQTFRLIPEHELESQELPSVDFRSLFNTGLLAAENIEKDGVSYLVTFCPTIVGKYQVVAHLHNQPVSEPYTFDVVPRIASDITNGHIGGTLSCSEQTVTDPICSGINAPETIFVVRTHIAIQVTQKGLTVDGATTDFIHATTCCNGHGCGTPPPTQSPTSLVETMDLPEPCLPLPQSSEPESPTVFHLRIQREPIRDSSVASTGLLTLYPVDEEPETDRTETRGLSNRASDLNEPGDSVLSPERIIESNSGPLESSLGVYPPRPYITELEKVF